MIFPKLVGGLVAGVVGISLYPVITEQISFAIAEANLVEGYSTKLLELTPHFFLGAVILSVLATIVSAFMDYGMIEVEEQVEQEYNPNKKQTYKEYVEERLRVERKMKYGWIGRWL